ncbi:MAG: HlyD family efflux transporter periplasmic adaptor subunit [bacterium]
MLLALVDGSRTPEQVAATYSERAGQPIALRTVVEFIEQLRSLGFLDEPGAVPLAAVAAPTPPLAAALATSPTPVGGVNVFFDVLAVFFGWLFHPLTLVPIVSMAMLGIAVLVQEWERYETQFGTLTRTLPILNLAIFSLAQTVVFMNLPREVAVGVACRRFGGRVRRFHLYWVADLIPFVNCDTGDSIHRMRDRARWTVLTAGLWTQVAIFAIAALGWGIADPHSDLSRFWLLLVPPCVVGLALHAVIFLRYDGYRILCAYLRDGQIRERALGETRAWLSGRPGPAALGERERFWLRAYGIGYYVFLVAAQLTLLIGGGWWLESRFGPSGLGFGLAVYLWAFRKEVGAIMTDNEGYRWLVRKGGSKTVRWALRIGGLIVVIVVLLAPYDREVSGECRVVAGAEVGLRAQLTDEVVAVHVTPGQEIEANQLVATLSGRELVTQLRTAEAELKHEQADLDRLLNGVRPEDLAIAEHERDLARSELAFAEDELKREQALLAGKASTAEKVETARRRRDSAQQRLSIADQNLAKTRQGARPEDIQAHQAEVERLTERVRYCTAQQALLEIRSPIAGRVMTQDIAERVGQVAEKGDLIAVIQDDRHLRVEVGAEEAAVPEVREGMPVHVRLRGLNGRLVTGKVASIVRTAAPESELDVDAYRTDREAHLQQSMKQSEDTYQVRVVVTLDPSDEKLSPGMTGFARIVIGPDVFGRAVIRPVLRYLRTEVWSWLP